MPAPVATTIYDDRQGKKVQWWENKGLMYIEAAVPCRLAIQMFLLNLCFALRMYHRLVYWIWRASLYCFCTLSVAFGSLDRSWFQVGVHA